MSDYRRRAYVFTLTVMCVLLLVTLIGAGITSAPSPTKPSVQATSIVKIIVEGGHGSGVHIGTGYILTAAHVVDGKTGIKLRSSIGDIQDVEILWINKARDVALLKAQRPDRLQSSALVCAPLALGQKITAEGNPGAAEFVRFRGEVAGSARQLGPWASIVPIDISGGPGISGGPIFDEMGRVSGIYVGIFLVPAGFSAMGIGLGAAVPSSVICELLAK